MVEQLMNGRKLMGVRGFVTLARTSSFCCNKAFSVVSRCMGKKLSWSGEQIVL